MNTNQYALDTARAKTPAERLRIVADLMEAQERGEQVHIQGDDDYACFNVSDDDIRRAYYMGFRIYTKRRPVLVIPALELFDGPLREPLQVHVPYFVPDPQREEGFRPAQWHGLLMDREWLDAGLIFRTPEGAAAVGLHIRNALAQAVAK
jgi:hypothetical protein